MQRNHSAQNRNELCATHWKKRRVLYWGRPIRQYLSPLLKSLLLSFATVRRRELYRSLAWYIMAFLTGGKGPGGVEDVSGSFHPKQGTVFSYLSLTYRLTFWQISPLLWGSRGPLGYAFGREIEPFNFSARRSQKLLKENYQMYISWNFSS